MSQKFHFYEAVADFISYGEMVAAVDALKALGVAPFDITSSPSAPQPPISVYILSACFSDATLFEPVREALLKCGGRDIDIQNME